MRYIGNKENIVQRIYEILDTKGIKGESFFDFCSGTASVAKFFKQKDYRVVASDLMYMSYCLQKAYIENNTTPEFEVVKTLALFGGKEEKVIEVEVGFLLNEKGKLVLGIYAPQLFRRAVQNVMDFWS